MIIRRNLAILVALLVALPAMANGVDRPNLEAGIGIGYLSPRATDLSNLYDGGPVYQLMVSKSISKPEGAISLEVGYFKSSADLSAPFFASNAVAELEWIPIDLVMRIRSAGRWSLSPHLGLGLQFLWAREHFDYRLAGQNRSQSPEDRFDPGILIVAGADRVSSPRLRLEGFLSVVPTDRRASVDGENYETGSDDTLDAGSFGIRVLWRLP